MGKKPAFLFYSNDFLLGTLALPMEDRGKYITLLCYMHEHGRLTEDMVIQLAGNVSDMLKAKFKIDKNGLWYNNRLEKEIGVRVKLIEAKKNNGKKGGRPKKATQVLAELDMPVADSCEAAKPEQVKECFMLRGLSATDAEYETLRFMAYYTGKGWKTNRGIPLKDWRAAVTNWVKRRNEFTTYKQPKTLTEQWLA